MANYSSEVILANIKYIVSTAKYTNGGKYNRFRVDGLPIDRTERRVALANRLHDWIDSNNQLAFVSNYDKWFKDGYALYQSLLSIINREELRATVWWHHTMPNYLVIINNDYDPIGTL